MQNVRTLITSAENAFMISNFDNQATNMLFSNISNEADAVQLQYDYDYNYKISIFFADGTIKGYYSVDDKEKLSAHGEIPINQININEKFVASNLVLFTDNGITLVQDTNVDFYKNLACDNTYVEK